MQNAHAHTNTAQLVYNYLLHSTTNKRTAASIAASTQLTTQQVCSALQNLQKRKLVTSTKQQSKRTQYSAVYMYNAAFNSVQRNAVAQAAQAVQTQHTTMLQQFVQAFKRMFA